MKSFYMATESGSSINLKLNIKKFEISIAADNSCNGYACTMMRHYIAVFEGNKNITNIIFEHNDLISEFEAFGTENNLLKAIEYCNNYI